MEFCVGPVHEAIAAAQGERPALVWRNRRIGWAELTERTRRLANVLVDAGLGCHRERSELADWESGQDHLAIYLHNGNEYLEAMLGAFKARLAPVNVNYRYVARELAHLLADCQAAAMVYQSTFAPLVAAVRHEVPSLRLLLQVDDGSGQALLPGALWYEEALASSSPDPPPVVPSPDDLYLLYTSGTTGRAKGVMWRQGDAWVECFGGSRTCRTMEEVVAAANVGVRTLVTPPFMHGAGQWISFRTWNLGGTVYVADHPHHLDPAAVWQQIERERLSSLLIVGDAFARPLLDELDRSRYDVSSLAVLLSGGAPLSAPLKAKLLDRLPWLMIVDGLGSSEAGGQIARVSTGGGEVTSGTFPRSPGNHVLSSDLQRELSPGDPEIGWLAKSGRLPLGYLGDVERTRRTYPFVNGVRYAVPGDRARLRADGVIELHGRDAATIITGGEKVFAEEVEAALRHHPSVYDVVVTSRPSDRWGNEVVALVQLALAPPATDQELLAEAGRHLARFKIPKAIVIVDEVRRSPTGKVDYRWAAEVAAATSTATPDAAI